MIFNAKNLIKAFYLNIIPSIVINRTARHIILINFHLFFICVTLLSFASPSFLISKYFQLFYRINLHHLNRKCGAQESLGTAAEGFSWWEDRLTVVSNLRLACWRKAQTDFDIWSAAKWQLKVVQKAETVQFDHVLRCTDGCWLQGEQENYCWMGLHEGIEADSILRLSEQAIRDDYNDGGKKSSRLFLNKSLQFSKEVSPAIWVQLNISLYNIWTFVVLEHSLFSDLSSATINQKVLKKAYFDRKSAMRGEEDIWRFDGDAMGINRRFSVAIIQLFQKEVLKLIMSFIFYINNGFATMATVEQFQGYYQNLGSFYSNADDLYASSAFPQTWTQSDLYTQTDTIAVQFPLPSNENPQNQSSMAQPRPEKPKKRMEKTLEKEILSAKKNSQSNIINQFYSFFSSREKSEKIVQKCALSLGKSADQVQKILSIFYTVIRFINAKRGRKYVNVAMFLKFFTPEDFGEYLSEMKDKIDSLQFLSVEELSEIMRKCTRYFLKEVSVSAILTSKRISVVSKEEHLKKRRKMVRTIMGH